MGPRPDQWLGSQTAEFGRLTRLTREDKDLPAMPRSSGFKGSHGGGADGHGP